MPAGQTLKAKFAVTSHSVALGAIKKTDAINLDVLD